jgi:hypothetical protein
MGSLHGFAKKKIITSLKLFFNDNGFYDFLMERRDEKDDEIRFS